MVASQDKKITVGLRGQPGLNSKILSHKIKNCDLCQNPS